MPAKKAARSVNRSDAPRKSLEEVEREIINKYGPGILIHGSELKGNPVRRITTGSLAYDMMLGGGWAINSWHEIIGDESSGKTSAVFKTIAANQDADPEWSVAWVASEPFVSSWAETAGMDLDRFKLVETAVMEEAYEIILEYVENRLYDCIVIDSYPALTPADESAEAMEQSFMGLGARLTGKFLRKSGPATKRSLTEEDRACTMLVVNQWREKIGIQFGDPRFTPGGRAKNYWYATRVEFTRREWIEYEKQRVGMVIQARTIKNKTAPPQRAAGVDFYFDNIPGFAAGQYDVAKDLLACGLWTDLIETRMGGNKGKHYEYFGQEWYGEANILASLYEDLGLRAQLRYDVLKSMGHEVEPPAPQKATRPARKAPAPRRLRRG